MTEAVIDGGAPAPAEITGAPIPEAVDIPQPLGSQTPVAEKPEAVIEAKPKSAGEALRSALDKVKAKSDEPAKDAPKADAKTVEAKVEPAKETKPVPDRGTDGKFAPKAAEQPKDASQIAQEAAKAPPAPVDSGKPASTLHEAPARFDAAAKAEWANAPESVKGAVHRTIRELETGIEEHRARWEPIKRYDDMAKQYGTDLPAALERYVAMDTLLSRDIGQGLDSIIRDKTGGQYGLREFVAQMTGQQPDQAQTRADATIHELRQQIGQLQQQIGGVVTHVRSQAETATAAQVAEFARGKNDFEALAPHIVEHIRNGKDLQTAYETARQDAEALARTLGYVPASQTPQQPLSPAPQPHPLNPAGQKSISGAPATGSDPASKTRNAPVPSIRDALVRARARVG